MPRPPVDKIVFVASIAVLSWFYGFATRAGSWFPTEHLSTAWKQARAVNPFRQPEYLHDRVYDRQGIRTPLPDRMQPGLTVITSAWKRGGRLTPGMRLIDERGTVLHEWSIDPAGIFADSPTRELGNADIDIHGSYLLPNGDVLVNLEYAGTLRLDACGRVRWRLAANNHHSIARADDGTFWIPAVTSRRLESPDHPEGFPGIQGPVYQDQLMRISEDGTVLDTINVLDVLYRSGLEWHLAEKTMLAYEDPTHVNDVEPLSDSLAAEYPLFEAGDLVVSSRLLSLVFVLDPESQRVKWQASRPQIWQHDPDFIGDGWIGILDNRSDGTERGTMLGGSRIIAFQPHTDSVKVLFPTELSEPFYTIHRGKWQMLQNGNMLLTEEAVGRVVEVAPDGRTVWEWIVEPVTASKVPAVTKATRIALTRGDVAGWPCASGRPAENEQESGR